MPPDRGLHLDDTSTIPVALDTGVEGINQEIASRVWERLSQNTRGAVDQCLRSDSHTFHCVSIEDEEDFETFGHPTYDVGVHNGGNVDLSSDSEGAVTSRSIFLHRTEGGEFQVFDDPLPLRNPATVKFTAAGIDSLMAEIAGCY